MSPSRARARRFLRSVPFYTVIANHDVHDKGPVANFDRSPRRARLLHGDASAADRSGDASASPRRSSARMPVLDAFKQAAGRAIPTSWRITPTITATRTLPAWMPTCTLTRPTLPFRRGSKPISKRRRTRRGSSWSFHHPSFNVGDEHYAGAAYARPVAALRADGRRRSFYTGMNIPTSGRARSRSRPTDLAGAKADQRQKAFGSRHVHRGQRRSMA